MKTRFLIAALMAGAMTLPVAAESPEEQGLAIALEARSRDEGWGDAQVDMSMILRDRQGREASRRMRSRALEVEDAGDKSLIIFDEPRDVEGTALLTWSARVGNDEQWIYLPALRRVRRIASNNKSGPFMGSEFAYEDLGSQEVEQYTYKYLRDDEYEDQPVFVFERYPVDSNSGYTRQIVWMDREHYRPLQIEFFDRRNEAMKTLKLHEYRQYLDRFWRPHRMEMVHHQTGKSTTLSFGEYTFDTGLSERDFDQNALSSAR
jgi:outer membrane lipoprotein-sorting protein